MGVVGGDVYVVGISIGQSKDRLKCSYFSAVNISCEIKSELTTYGFSAWKHTVGGSFVKQVDSVTDGQLSTVVIDKCGLADVGNYTCASWATFGNVTEWANSTSSLIVIGIPVIVRTFVSRNSTTTLCVQFYSEPEPINLKWYLNRILLENSSQFTQTVIRTTVRVNINERDRSLQGYEGNLTFKNYDDYLFGNQFVVIIQNKIGKATKIFREEIKSTRFSLQIILFVVSGFGVVIMSVTATPILLKKCRTSCTNRYSYRIYFGAPSNTNRGTDQHYEEIGDIVVPVVLSDGQLRDEESSKEESESGEAQGSHYIELD